jgi:hypothetical protein
MGLLKTVGIIIVIVAVVAFVLWYFNIDVIGMLSGSLAGVLDWFTGLSDTAKALYVTAAGAFGGGIGWLKTKLNFNSFKKQTVNANAEMGQKMDELHKISAKKDETIQNVTTRAETAEAKVQNLESEYENYKTVLDAKEAKIADLESQIKGLSKQNVDNLAEEVSKKIVEKERKS